MKWSYTPDEVVSEAFDIINKSKNRYSNIINHNENYIDVVNLLMIDYREREETHSKFNFLKYVSNDPIIRQACSKVDILLDDYETQLNSDSNIYNILTNVFLKNKDKMDELLQNFFLKIIETHINNGIKLDKKLKRKFITIDEEINKLNRDRLRNIEKEQSHIKISLANLKNVPSVLLDKLPTSKKDKNKKIINLKASYINLLFGMIKSDKIRQKMDHYMGIRSKNNILIDQQLLQLKHQKSQLLDKKNYFEFINEDKIIKDHRTIFLILEKLSNYISDKYDAEMISILKTIKAKKGLNINLDAFKNKINEWDIQYYFTYLRKKFLLDEFKVREYFRTVYVVNKVMKGYKELFGLKFKEIKNSEVWHPSVKLFEIYEKDKFLGSFYLDIYKRRGKFNGLKFFNLQSTCDIFKQKSVSVLIANFDQETKNKVSLMSYSQMKHFIHEFCHIIHNSLIQSHYPLFGIKQLSKDIYDIPCYLMQKIFLENDNLKKLTKNYRTNNKLDNDTIKKMKQSDNIDIAYKTKKEIMYSLYDLFIHSKEKFCKIMKDNKNALKELYDKYFENVFENQNIIMNKNNEKYPFSHLKKMEGEYYLKILNDSYACDIYLKSSNKEKLISTIKDIMKCGAKISSPTIIEKYFGCKLDLLSYVKYYNIETNDQIENYNEISQDSHNKIKEIENINLTSEVPKIEKNEFKEIYTEDSSCSYDNKKIFSKN
ncbi:MAG: hypothetical protein CMF62_03200 [Magnetococcales bacterium]|nr:hypothetical protein [Magnetococcales bacterium]